MSGSIILDLRPGARYIELKMASRTQIILLALFTFVSWTAGSVIAWKETNIPSHPTFSFDTLDRLNQNFWNRFIYPHNVDEALSLNSTLFSEDVIGRVDDSRTFYGRELNTEYVFGSFATLGTNGSIMSILGVPIDHENIRIATHQNMMSVTERVLFNITFLNMVVPVQIEMWFAFNAQEEIIAYDTSFRWFTWLFDDILRGLKIHEPDVTHADSLVSAFKSILVRQICDTATEYCSEPHTIQYESHSQCVDFLNQQVRLGSSYEFGMDTILCRSLHQLMLPLRPLVHCPHIGPAGGGMCVDDLEYSTVVNSDVVGHGRSMSTHWSDKPKK